MSLLAQFWQFSEDFRRGVIVLRLDLKPRGLVKDWIKSSGFRPMELPLTWGRRLDANGRAAAEYLRKQLEEDL